MMQTKAVMIAALAAAGLLVACGDLQSGSRLRPDPGNPRMEWERPPINSVPVSSAAEASRYLAFTPREPKGLESPQAIYAQSAGPDSERKDQGVVFFFDTQQYGLVRVSMEIDGLSAEERHKFSLESVALSDDPGTQGDVEITTIKGGTEAVLGFPIDNSVNISWREGSILIVVAGPKLTREQAISIAENL